MQAWELSAFNTAPEIRELPMPRPNQGEIRVRIAACGLNFADLLMIEGKYQDTPTPPFVMGLELAGVVDALGDGVTTHAVGDSVAVYAGQGGLAEYGCFPAQRALRLPDHMPLTEAAGFLIAYGTSHLALTRRARLAAGETLAVLGAAGGVGLTAVEIGASLGAKVIAVARGQAKLEIAKRAGADHVIDADTPDLRDQLRALGGVDVLYDAVGGAGFEAGFRAMRPEGRILSIGFASGTVPQIPANHLLVKNLDVMGLYWGGYLRFNPEALHHSLEQVFGLYTQGGLKPHIGATYPFDALPAALDALRSRKSTGKLVIEIAKTL
ncbi:zinc-binding dehydrogenase [Rhodobacterales bacterium LSUCC1028]|jgi:NADPH2:quinone reductase|uniref:NADPH:quinone oxidoreductase family protein n=1 Tax=Roseobacter sp. HKCCA2468 TaxID=3120342 RepID=UPI001DD227AC|nr:zinc-binding dehydrogenase [Rhodobacterales bacterium FZCC0188]MBF9054874.1 zinc-binding dehydrogenase [Rhodobacterales bacterium LSUCC1028]